MSSTTTCGRCYPLNRCHCRDVESPTPGSDQDLSTVDDRWSSLLKLIAQYGGERYMAGWQDHGLMVKGQPIKRMATGEVEPDSLIARITHEILKLQREMGDD